MADERALTRLLDELAWVLRREGFVVAPSQMIDLLRVARALGWDDAVTLQEAISAVVVKRAIDLPRFDATFKAFFAQRAPSRDFWERMRLQGFTQDEIAVVRELLESLQTRTGALMALLEGGIHVDSLLVLAAIQRELRAATSPLQFGFMTHRAAELAGVRVAHGVLAQLRQRLRDALGARGDVAADALQRELEHASDALRARVRESLARQISDARIAAQRRGLADTPLTSLGDLDLLEIRRAVRAFADRLRGAERVRLRRARRGRIDVPRTMRLAAQTGGVPFKPIRRRRRHDKPRLIVLCDISESVRTASRFMLEFLYAAHDLFDRTRSFVFVSDVGETTTLLKREPPSVALAAIYGGGVIAVVDNSNYGRVFRQFEGQRHALIDGRTTVVILGDGRNNYHDPAESALARIRARARALYWLCPEPRSGWLMGDSAMSRYAPLCDRVFEVTTAGELLAAARSLALSR